MVVLLKCDQAPPTERKSCAIVKQDAASKAASLTVVNAVAIADAEVLLGAISPDGLLHEARKYPRVVDIEGATVNVASYVTQDSGAAVASIASWAVLVLPAHQAPRNAGSGQEVVHQAVYRDHVATDCNPKGLPAVGTQKKSRKRHAQNFRRQPVHLSHRFDQGFGTIQASRTGLLNAVINPPDEITSRYISHEQVEGEGGLTKITSPQVKFWDGAIPEMARALKGDNQ